MQIGIPPDPNVLMIPMFGMLTGVVITGMVVLGPVGRAIGDGLRHLFGAHKDKAGLSPTDLDEILGRLDAIQHQLGELAERQDFTERVLSQVRKDRALAGGTDVSG